MHQLLTEGLVLAIVGAVLGELAYVLLSLFASQKVHFAAAARHGARGGTYCDDV